MKNRILNIRIGKTDRDSALLYDARIPGTGRVMIRKARFHGERVRLLVVNGAVQSATYVKREMRNRLIFDYMKDFDWALRLLPSAKRLLLIGGGAGSYPKHLMEENPGLQVDVIEKSEEIETLAEEFFYYRPQGEVTIDDGFHALSVSEKTYDIIINDAFSGKHADAALSGRRGIAEVRRHLSHGGIYVINMATALKGPFAVRGRIELALLRKHFQYTMLLPVHAEKSGYEPQNCLLFASACEFRFFR